MNAPNHFIANAAGAVPADRLPDFFPKSVSNCQQPAQVFFTCFFTGSQKNGPDDTQAGSRGLKSCLAEKNAYQDCMFNHEAKNGPSSKLYRVK